MGIVNHNFDAERRSFRVIPADNGGWLLQVEDRAREGMYAPPAATFTNDEDLVQYLKDELGVD